jgi:hypothetical protein
MTAAGKPTSFDEVLEACLAAIEEQGEVAVEDACLRHPEHADRLRRRVQLLAAANLVDLSAGLARIPARLGDFELLERIGTGGMGVVHRARSVSTGRYVAVKLVRPELLAFAEAKSRLAREVELSARLHHESILPVFAVGETDGLPWFAMELVAGTSLAAVTNELRKRGRAPGDVDTDEVAAIVAELTPQALKDTVDFGRTRPWSEWSLDATRRMVDAIAYAHGKGVLHRDLKPSNVLVDLAGRVHLCDFGLASDSGDGSLTRSGSAVGSLPYMPPEVLDGQPADARSDVYGLGGLAYELATLHRPFEGESTGALVKAILTERPPSPRVHAPKLALDFEAVVLRALERDPQRRYATASELREDLDALVDRRPTRARPIGPLARLARAAQRRPVLATASTLGVLALVAGPVGWQINQNQAAAKIALAYEKERDANALSDRHFAAALAAIGTVLRETAAEELEDVPRMQTARLTAIDRATDVLREIANDRPDDTRLLMERAKLLESRADVLHDMSRYEEAIADALACSELLAPLVAADPNARMLRIAALHHAALSYVSLARHAEALEVQRTTVAEMRAMLAERAWPADLSERDLERRVAVELVSLSEGLRVVESVEACEVTLHEAEAILRRLLANEPPGDPDPMVHSGLARVLQDLGDNALERGDVDAAEASYEESLERYQEAYKRSPGSRYHVFDLSLAHFSLSLVANARGELDVFETQLFEALELIDELTTEFPESARYHDHRMNVLDRLAMVYASTGRGDEALALFEKLYNARRAMLEIQLGDVTTVYDFALAANNFANILLQERVQFERMVEVTESGIERLDELRAITDTRFNVPLLATGLTYLRAIALTLAGRIDEARIAIEDFDEKALDASAARFAADLWNEYLIALPEDAQSVEPGFAPPRTLARERLFAALERAIEQGYADLDELSTTPALDVVREDPRFVELLERIRAR